MAESSVAFWLVCLSSWAAAQWTAQKFSIELFHLPLISLREGISIVAISCSVSTNTHGINASRCDWVFSKTSTGWWYNLGFCNVSKSMLENRAMVVTEWGECGGVESGQKLFRFGVVAEGKMLGPCRDWWGKWHWCPVAKGVQGSAGWAQLCGKKRDVLA